MSNIVVTTPGQITTGSTTADTITGTAGNDVINAGGGDDIVNAGNGNDTVRGGDGNDTLYGEGGNDILDGGTGDDTLVGGIGNDVYVVDSDGDLVIELDGEGVDQVKSWISYTLGAAVENLLLMGNDRIDGIGNALANSMVGNGNDNRLWGVAGNDQLDGGGGNDWLAGGAGNDWTAGGAGADVFAFDRGDIANGSGVDQISDLNFGAGDRIQLTGYYEGGARTLASYAGLVQFMDSHSNFTVAKRNEGGAINVTIAQPGGVSQVITITDASGNGTAWSQFEAAAVRPVANADTATTDESHTVTINVLANDTGPDLDIASASSAKGGVAIVNSMLVFNPEDDFSYLAGGETATTTINYTIVTAAGRSASSTVTVTVTGLDNAPEFSGALAGDVWEGGVTTATGQAIVHDADHDQSSFRAESVEGEFGTLTINAAGEWSYALNEGAEGLRTLNSGENAVERIEIRSEDGTFHSVEVTVHGSDELVTLPETYAGADPNDHDGVTGGGVLFSTLTTGALNGANTLYGTSGADTIDARNGNDVVYGWGGDDFIAGGNGLDSIYGGSGDDEIQGNQANDTLYGGSGDDKISGIAGDDVIVGGFGADLLTGNTGADTFRFLDIRDTNDLITDFTPGSDKIDLSNVTANGSTYHFDAPVEAHTFTAARDLIWYFDGANTVILGNTDGDLTTAEFMLTIAGNPHLQPGDILF